VSKQFNLYKETLKAGTIEKLEKLRETVNSEEFKKEKAYLLLSYNDKWGQTEESKEALEYSKVSNDQKIKDYIKFIASKELKLFEEVSKTNEIAEFEALEAFIKSDSFKETKTYTSLPFKEKWAKTTEFTQFQEFTTLKNSEKVKWYFKIVNSTKFDEVNSWKLTFFEDFSAPKLDKDKWITRFYYGDTLLNDSFSLSDDKHFNTNGENISISNSILSITTKREKATGKAWNPMAGFIPKEFDYTSGIINTGKSFRQKHGRFVAKIKVNDNNAITHAFWLVGNQIMPQIDIMKYTKGKVYFSNFWGNITEKNGINRSTDNLSGSRLKSDFHIYELIWTPDELIWKINNLVIRREKNGIPSEPMYILLSSGIFNDVSNQDFPVSMEIDWVKCYEKIIAS
jgi:beta-glucanase (GH16 family)